MTQSSPEAARFAPNGNPFTAIVFLDFNSMYLWSQLQVQPLTPGLRWVKNGPRFQKRILSPNSSFGALQYLYYCQALLAVTHPGLNIEHQYFHGERTVYGHKVDGYVNIDGKEIVFEYNGEFLVPFLVIKSVPSYTQLFLGCYWHGCKCIPNMTPKQRNRLQKWNKKAEELRSNGVEVRLMRECEWKNILPSITETQTRMPRILKHDTEESLLEAIKNDEVFGFAVCSISTDSKDIEKMEKMGYLFPPIIQRQEINFAEACESIKPLIKQKNKNKKVETVVQTYNAQDQLIMTPIIRYTLGTNIY